MTINSRQKGAEIWKPVVGYEGLYEVSNLGRVKSLPKYHQNKERIMSQYINQHNGYAYVGLSKDGEHRQHRVHKLVMEAFTDYRSMGRGSEYEIDHIDCNRSNNYIGNLQVVTHTENMRKAHYVTGINYSGTKCIDLTTGIVYDTFQDAAKSIGGKRGEMVRRVCNGKRSHYRNHKFARYEDYINGTIPEYTGKTVKKASETLWR